MSGAPACSACARGEKPRRLRGRRLHGDAPCTASPDRALAVSLAERLPAWKPGTDGHDPGDEDRRSGPDMEPLPATLEALGRCGGHVPAALVRKILERDGFVFPPYATAAGPGR